MLRGDDTGWTFTDRVLAVAAMLADDLRCPGCGHPKHEAWNPDSTGWYEIREAECQGCAAIELAAEGDKKPRAELKRWVQDVRPPEVELRPWSPAGAAPLAAGLPG